MSLPCCEDSPGQDESTLCQRHFPGAIEHTYAQTAIIIIIIVIIITLGWCVCVCVCFQPQDSIIIIILVTTTTPTHMILPERKRPRCDGRKKNCGNTQKNSTTNAGSVGVLNRPSCYKLSLFLLVIPSPLEAVFSPANPVPLPEPTHAASTHSDTCFRTACRHTAGHARFVVARARSPPTTHARTHEHTSKGPA